MLEGSFIRKQLGPLPVWAWMGLVLLGALIISMWRRNKADAGDGDGVTQTYELPESLQPTYVFQNYDQDRTTIITGPELPPGGGRPTTPPVTGQPVTPPPATTPGPVTGRPVPPPPATRPAPTPKPKPIAPAKGVYVSVVPYKKGQPKGTPSTLWGIAEKVYGKASDALWQQIWNHPSNATLRRKRGAPNKIQPGDRVWVPK